MGEIAFIICYNDKILLEECKMYLNRLYVPEGFSIDIITVAEAPSMCAGYNAAMKSSDAEIKVYIHQDTFIVNRYFLYNINYIFKSDEQIGIIGIVGSDNLPDSAVWWEGNIKGSLPFTREEYRDEKITDRTEVFETVVVDGFLIATSKDIEWREDIFKGFDFYDLSQCFEFRRRGFKIVTVKQTIPWCIHADGYFMDLENYSDTRNAFYMEYGRDDFSLDGRKCNLLNGVQKSSAFDDYNSKKDEYNKFQSTFENNISDALKRCDYEAVSELYLESVNYIGRKELTGNISADYLRFMVIMDIYLAESERGESFILKNAENISELLGKFRKTEIYLRRFEYDFDDYKEHEESFGFIKREKISAYAIEEFLKAEVAQLGNVDRIRNKAAHGR